MAKKEYTINVSGVREDRERLLGSLLENSANLTRSFSRKDGVFFFSFRYKSDARSVLKRMSKQLVGKNTLTNDAFNYRRAVASIQ